ncbi:MAG TPA: hypothetical protein VNO30_32095 [Kofleriaceae bacterium]|nr:hypothetical protein [Kofleriaceae bacterium]
MAVLFVFPFPLGALPWTERLYGLLTTPLEWLTCWTATHVLGLGEISTQPTGSGDTTATYVQNLVIAALAAIGTIVWSVLDRKRTAYPQLAASAVVVLRYYLAFTLLGYAVAKLSQFPPPSPTRLDQRVGDMSPMGMLWTFMGTSQPYTLFAGIVEGVPGILLLWRRTYVAGALLAAMAMGNVVALNFSYDVPVKLFSTQLFLIAVVLLTPHARQLISALLGSATPEIPPRPRRAPSIERARLAAKAMLLSAAALSLYQQVDQAHAWRRPPRHALHGIWVVDKYVTDGVERPPLLTDAERWHKLHLWGRGAAVRPMQGPVVRFEALLDPARRTIAAKPAGHLEPWTYTPGAADAERGAPTTLVIDGTFHGRPFHAELHREPEPLLVTRGFHWISEVPYNR